MREFPNATPRPWAVETEAETDEEQPEVYVCSAGTVCDYTVVATMGRSVSIPQDRKQADAALIGHAVNTYEERERLLDEAAEVLRNLCIAIDAEADLGRPFPERYPRTVKDVRAILAKLEARDA